MTTGWKKAPAVAAAAAVCLMWGCGKAKPKAAAGEEAEKKHPDQQQPGCDEHPPAVPPCAKGDSGDWIFSVGSVPTCTRGDHRGVPLGTIGRGTKRAGEHRNVRLIGFFHGFHLPWLYHQAGSFPAVYCGSVVASSFFGTRSSFALARSWSIPSTEFLCVTL